MPTRSFHKVASAIRFVIFVALAMFLILFALLGVSVIQDGISSKLIALDTAATDQIRSTVRKDAIIANLPFGIGWFVITSTCVFFAYRNARHILQRNTRQAEQGAAANP